MKTSDMPILVVDDDPMVRKFIGHCLRRQGYVVLEAGIGGGSDELCRANKGRIALGLFDVIMPDIHGPILKRSIERIYPELRVLFMSGFPHVGVHQSRHGGFHFQAIHVSNPAGPSARGAERGGQRRFPFCARRGEALPYSQPVADAVFRALRAVRGAAAMSLHAARNNSATLQAARNTRRGGAEHPRRPLDTCPNPAVSM